MTWGFPYMHVFIITVMSALGFQNGLNRKGAKVAKILGDGEIK